MGVELLYNSVKTEIKREVKTARVPVRVGVGDGRDVVGKVTPGRRGPREPWLNWGPEKTLIRCNKESQHPAEWTSGPPVEHQENEKDTTLPAIKVEVKILKFLFGLQPPLTLKPWVTLFETLAIKWEVNILLKKSTCVCLYYCYSFCMNLHMTI